MMTTKSDRNAFLDGFFDGFGPIGLFFRTERPDAPTKVFADETARNEQARSLGGSKHGVDCDVYEF
jgi:hypothetical protein